MAAMSKGQPRSVPDPAGEAYDKLMLTLRTAGDHAGRFFGRLAPIADKARDILVFPADAVGGAGDFARNYRDMRESGWIDGDKYFHCKANCEAAQRGPGGAFIAEKISNLREITDQRIKGDTRADALADQAANRVGRTGGGAAPKTSCSSICSSLRPRGLPPRY